MGLEQAVNPYLLMLIVVLGFALKVNFNKTDTQVGWAYLFLITRAAFTSFGLREESPDWLLPVVNNLELRFTSYVLVVVLLVYKIKVATEGNFMQSLKDLLGSNSFRSFLVALAGFLGSYPFTQADFSWVSFVVAGGMFGLNFYTSHLAKREAVAATTASLIPFTYPAPTESGSIVVAPEVTPNEPDNQNTSTI